MDKLGGHKFDLQMQLLFCQSKTRKPRPNTPKSMEKSTKSRIFSKQLATS